MDGEHEAVFSSCACHDVGCAGLTHTLESIFALRRTRAACHTASASASSPRRAHHPSQPLGHLYLSAAAPAVANWLRFPVGLCAASPCLAARSTVLCRRGVAVVTRPIGTPRPGPFIPPALLAVRHALLLRQEGGHNAARLRKLPRRLPSVQLRRVNSCSADTPSGSESM